MMYFIKLVEDKHLLVTLKIKKLKELKEKIKELKEKIDF